MELSTQQIKDIKLRLEYENLLFDDFKEEMLDHVCSALESHLGQEDFETKLENVFNDFSGNIFTTSSHKWSEPVIYNGLAALEIQKFQDQCNSISKKYFKYIVQSILHWKGVIGAILLYFFLKIESSLVALFRFEFDNLAFIQGLILGVFTVWLPIWLFNNNAHVLFLKHLRIISRVFRLSHLRLSKVYAVDSLLIWTFLLLFVLLFLIISLNIFHIQGSLSILGLLIFVSLHAYVVLRNSVALS